MMAQSFTVRSSLCMSTYSAQVKFVRLCHGPHDRHWQHECWASGYVCQGTGEHGRRSASKYNEYFAGATDIQVSRYFDITRPHRSFTFKKHTPTVARNSRTDLDWKSTQRTRRTQRTQRNLDSRSGAVGRADRGDIRMRSLRRSLLAEK